MRALVCLELENLLLLYIMYRTFGRGMVSEGFTVVSQLLMQVIVWRCVNTPPVLTVSPLTIFFVSLYRHFINTYSVLCV